MFYIQLCVIQYQSTTNPLWLYEIFSPFMTHLGELVWLCEIFSPFMAYSGEPLPPGEPARTLIIQSF